MPGQESRATFAPQLVLSDGAAAIEFYKTAFGMIELRRWNNDDGSVHVAELSFEGAMFHIRQESVKQLNLSPETAGGNTVILGIFVNDVDAIINRAVEAGAILLSEPQDYEYGYRQGDVRDPFGHHWLIEKKI